MRIKKKEKEISDNIITSESFSNYIEKHRKNFDSYIDTIINFCDKEKCDFDYIKELLSKPLLEKVKYEAMKNKMLKEKCPVELEF